MQESRLPTVWRKTTYTTKALTTFSKSISCLEQHRRRYWTRGEVDTSVHWRRGKPRRAIPARDNAAPGGAVLAKVDGAIRAPRAASIGGRVSRGPIKS